MRTLINCIRILIWIYFASVTPHRFSVSLPTAFAPMFVCLCNPVTESQIRFCATDGCASFREMAAKLGVAQQCGRCACHAKEVFDHARAVPASASRRMAPSRTNRPVNVSVYTPPRIDANTAAS